MWNFILNPHNRYRAESASSTAYLIPIDGHYQVNTTSANDSVLSYIQNAQAISGKRKTLSQAFDRLNWDDNYIIVSTKRSNGNESFMIINRETVETTGYLKETEFQEGTK